MKMLKAASFITPPTEVEVIKGPFPLWSEERRIYLSEIHSLINQDDLQIIRQNDPSVAEEYELEFYHENCLLCHEFHSLDILFKWYHEVFLRSLTKTFLLSNGDATLDLSPPSLIIHGNSQLGKSFWFQSICNFHQDKIVYARGSGTPKQEMQKLKRAWILLFDNCDVNTVKEFNYVRGLLAGEGVYVAGKFLRPKVPCVLLTNNFDLFEALKKEETVCRNSKYISLGSINIGPNDNTGLEMSSFINMSNAI
jgi:hypothetical protein